MPWGAFAMPSRTDEENPESAHPELPFTKAFTVAVILEPQTTANYRPARLCRESVRLPSCERYSLVKAPSV